MVEASPRERVGRLAFLAVQPVNREKLVAGEKPVAREKPEVSEVQPELGELRQPAACPAAAECRRAKAEEPLQRGLMEWPVARAI